MDVVLHVGYCNYYGDVSHEYDESMDMRLTYVLRLNIGMYQIALIV